MNWIIESIKRILGADKAFGRPFKKEDKTLQKELKREDKDREEEMKEINELHKDISDEITDIIESISDLDTGLKLTEKKIEDFNTISNNFKLFNAENISDNVINETKTSLINVLLLNVRIKDEFKDTKKRIEEDYKIDKKEEKIIDKLEEENKDELINEEKEEKLFHESFDQEDEEFTEEKIKIDKDELKEESKIESDIKLDEQFIEKIKSENLFDSFLVHIESQNKILKNMSKDIKDINSENLLSELSKIKKISEDYSNQILEFCDKTLKEKEFFEKIEQIEKNRKIIMEEESKHELEIQEEESVARVLEKKVKNEEKEESEYRNDLSKDNYIKFT